MDLSKKKKTKTMNSKMTTNSHLSTTEPKKRNQNQKQIKQTTKIGTEIRNGDQMESNQWGGKGGRMGEKVQGISSINVR